MQGSHGIAVVDVANVNAMNRFVLIGGAVVTVCLLLLAAVLAPAGSSVSPKSEPPAGIEKPTRPSQQLAGMVWVSGGKFSMGTDDLPPPNAENPHRIKPDEYPAHQVELSGFWLDATPVTNREFAEFVAMTGHVTFAERRPTREDFARSGVDANLIPDDKLTAGSICFNRNFDRANLITGVPNWEYQVWEVVDGANWRHPEGPASDITDRLDHPVVHINWDDAEAYCHWAGKRLPTEAEFEYAARNRGQNVLYPWGNELAPGGKYRANFWQGEFPVTQLEEDGYQGTSPVKAFPPNELGLYDMAGNVWEWCSDYYHPFYYEASPRLNPQGPSESYDPQEPGIIKRVQRGGSFMCNANSCTGYRSSARMRAEIMSSTFHGGFRCAVSEQNLTVYQAEQAKIAAWRAAQVPAN